MIASHFASKLERRPGSVDIGFAHRYHGCMSRRSFVAALLLVALAPVAAACSDSDSKPTTTAPDDGASVEAGEQLFRTAGCVACHGADARGTVAGPDLHGHTADQVRFQVRTPYGTMPSYDTAAVSNDGLEDLAVFIVSLAADDGHDHDHTH